MCRADEEFYRAAGKSFLFVGPLLDVVGATRGQTGQVGGGQQQQRELLRRAKDAAAQGRPVVYVSMGTVVTSDDAAHGWTATDGSAVTGKQICQAVFRAVFEEFGAAEGRTRADQDTPLIVVALGPQPDALEDLAVPSNALCAMFVPQADLLRATRPALFITNGGQNSLMESLAAGTPVLVCPGFGDQVSNAAKVVWRGCGARVERPCGAGDGEGALATYRARVRQSAREVMESKVCATQARRIASGLEEADGVEGALRILVETARC